MKYVLLALAAGFGAASFAGSASAQTRYNGDYVYKRPPYIQYRSGYGTVYRKGDSGEYTYDRRGRKVYLQSPYYADQGNYPEWAQRAFNPRWNRR